jgi:hypothetical protein
MTLCELKCDRCGHVSRVNEHHAQWTHCKKCQNHVLRFVGPAEAAQKPVEVTYKVLGTPDILTESVVPIPLDSDCVEKLAKLARQSNRDTATETE